MLRLAHYWVNTDYCDCTAVYFSWNSRDGLGMEKKNRRRETFWLMKKKVDKDATLLDFTHMWCFLFYEWTWITTEPPLVPLSLFPKGSLITLQYYNHAILSILQQPAHSFPINKQVLEHSRWWRTSIDLWVTSRRTRSEDRRKHN